MAILALSPICPPNAPKCTKSAPKVHQKSPRAAEEAPSRPQETTKEPQRGPRKAPEPARRSFQCIWARLFIPSLSQYDKLYVSPGYSFYKPRVVFSFRSFKQDTEYPNKNPWPYV